MSHNSNFISTRRQILAGVGSLAATALLPKISRSQNETKTRLVLLGTKGGPTLGRGRSNSSTVILINGVPYLIDCGYGVSRQLILAGVSLDRLRYIFITHHHSDHNLEYGTLLYNALIASAPSRIDAYGPTGLRKMTQDFFRYEQFDIETRLKDEGGADGRKLIFVHDFAGAGLVMQNGDVKVTSLRVRHPPITQSYAFRFDARDRSVVISGDTAYAPELAVFARGADVLVHEAMYLPGVEGLVKRFPDATLLRRHLLASHTSTEDVGRIAALAGVKTLVLSHLVPGDDPSITDEQWAEGARAQFKGRIIVGKDLMEI
jgi:ribonuclease BN (tRNA processing enzyme)